MPFLLYVQFGFMLLITELLLPCRNEDTSSIHEYA